MFWCHLGSLNSSKQRDSTRIPSVSVIRFIQIHCFAMHDCVDIFNHLVLIESKPRDEHVPSAFDLSPLPPPLHWFISRKWEERLGTLVCSWRRWIIYWKKWTSMKNRMGKKPRNVGYTSEKKELTRKELLFSHQNSITGQSIRTNFLIFQPRLASEGQLSAEPFRLNGQTRAGRTVEILQYSRVEYEVRIWNMTAKWCFSNINFQKQSAGTQNSSRVNTLLQDTILIHQYFKHESF